MRSEVLFRYLFRKNFYMTLNTAFFVVVYQFVDRTEDTVIDGDGKENDPLRMPKSKVHA